MRFIESRVSQAEAIRFFQRRRLGNLWGLFMRPDPNVGTLKRMPYLERIWLSYYQIPIDVTSVHGPGVITVSVEAHSGAFAIFEMHKDIVEGELEGQAFPPKLTEEEAAVIGRKGLLKSIMRRRGQRGKPVVHSPGAAEVFYYPYWVYYYERRRGFIDIKALDALTREKAGARTKVGILGAFAAVGDRSG